MKVYEKVKEMSMDELLAFLRLLEADADDIYCSSICMQVCSQHDCHSLDTLAEVLKADYSLIENKIRAENIKKLPQVEVINGYRISQAKNYHVSIRKDNRLLFHCECNKVENLQDILDFYLMIKNK